MIVDKTFIMSKGDCVPFKPSRFLDSFKFRTDHTTKAGNNATCTYDNK